LSGFENTFIGITCLFKLTAIYKLRLFSGYHP